MKNNQKKSPTMKIVSAAAMLAVSAAMLSTSTYAWFTMSREVKVDGMMLKTKVSGNLLISDTNTSDAYYGTELSQSINALLEPVSSVKGVNDTFWYTLDAAADGHKLHSVTGDGAITYKDYETDYAADATADGYANLFSQNYAVTETMAASAFTGETSAKGYVDYVFYLKAVPDGDNNAIRMTRCNLAYNDAAITPTTGEDTTILDRAWRIAVFSEATTVGTTNANPASADSKLKGGNPLGLATASYFDNTAVSAANAKSAASTTNSGVVIANDLPAGTPAYYKVVVRVWLEGEDPSCKTETYVELNDAWKLDLQFDLVPTADTDSPAVTAIGTSAPATVNDDVPRAAAQNNNNGQGGGDQQGGGNG